VDNGVRADGVVLESIEGGPAQDPILDRAGRAWTLDVPTDGRAAVAYRLRYDVTRDAGLDGRCPIWLPLAAGSGRAVVTIDVSLPRGWMPGNDSFPALGWDGVTGRATLANVPALVHAPAHPPGARPSAWRRVGMHRLVDASALLLALASAWWAVSRRR
jgi:hypothetical protein